ncbi:MAG TPA: efflux RND transporter periplasmic adaptor subunit [Thermoanaerobaculia bacterium]|nr:efflux RND transporter periplasmic adaptor subunit [Thermoanaerobaculia bacterium]
MNFKTTLGLATALALMMSCHQASDTAPTDSAAAKAAAPNNVRTQAVELSTFRRAIETTGTVAFNQNRSTQVLSPISGPVSRILVGVGARVSRGEALAVVASPDFAADVSALRKAEATARNARRIADLDQQLFKNDAIARRDLEQAQTEAVNAEADRDAAIQQLRSVGLDETTIAAIRENRPVENLGGLIRAPISGTVVEKLVSPGQLLQAATTPAFTVADLSRVWVLANVFEKDLPSVHIGDAADVITGSGQTLPGKVDYIAAIVDPATRAVSVRLDVANPGEVLKRDLYVRVTIHSQTPAQGLLVPVSAVLRDDENLPYVFVSKAGGGFERRRVTIGSRIGDRQEITAGLRASESIVVEGGLFLETEEHP